MPAKFFENTIKKQDFKTILSHFGNDQSTLML